MRDGLTRADPFLLEACLSRGRFLIELILYSTFYEAAAGQKLHVRRWTNSSEILQKKLMKSNQKQVGLILWDSPDKHHIKKSEDTTNERSNLVCRKMGIWKER